MISHPPDGDRISLDEALFGGGFSLPGRPELPECAPLGPVPLPAEPCPPPYPFPHAVAHPQVAVVEPEADAPPTEAVDLPRGYVHPESREAGPAEAAPEEVEPEPPAYTLPEEPACPPEPPPACVLEVNRGLELTAGGTAVIRPDQLRLSCPVPRPLEVMILSPTEHGTLLRDGFALTGGDLFTQDDINEGRVRYRHDGGSCRDGFTFATPDGEVQPAIFPITLRPARRAPELLGPGSLDGLLDGRTVADLLGGQARCHDPSESAGIAVVAVAGRGAWHYSLDGRRTWRELNDARHARALLLRGSDAVRFIPRPGWSGTVKLTYRAWDRSSGRAGECADLSARDAAGGATAFSRATASAQLVIPPSLPETPSAGPCEGTPTLAELTGDGLAVVRLEGEGTWQYSLDDGRTWQNAEKVYHGRALLLRAADRVRFLPRKGAAGRVILSGRAWDGRGGTASGTASVASRGSYGEGTPFGEFVLTRAWWLAGE